MARATLLLLVAALSGWAVALPGLREKLQEIAEEKSKTYNCSVAIAFRSASTSIAVAAGAKDLATMAPIAVTDPLVWGSVTKVLTGSSILQLASEGKLALDDPIPQHVDPILRDMARIDPTQNFTSLRELYGPNVTKVTVRQLLSMQSGIPDFDTAHVCHTQGCTPDDLLRKHLYENPKLGYNPTQLLSLPWVAYNQTVRPHYSSTNFVLLGLILAHYKGQDTWETYRQGAYIPEPLRTALDLKFGVGIGPWNATTVHGYDRTPYNNNTGQIDVFDVHGVFTGWTASDLVGTADSVAELIYNIYGPPAAIAPREWIDKMIPTNEFYGLATFNLTSRTGQENKYGRAYGHLGATYGYQSIVTYHPELDMTFAIGTNLELYTQPQPSDILCYAFNTAASLALGQNVTCTFTPGSYWKGECKCTQLK